MKFALLLCLFLVGCGNQYEDMNKPDLFEVQPYTVLESAPSNKRANAMHKLVLDEKFEFDSVELNDIVMSGKHAYAAVGRREVAKVNLASKRAKIVDMGHDINKIVKLKDGVAGYNKGKNQYVLIWKEGSEVTLHKFDGFISNVIPYNKDIIVVTTNGLCICYDYKTRTKIWESVPHNQFKHGLKASELFQDSVVFVDPLGRLTFIDVDNGTIGEYKSIADCYGKSRTAISCTNEGLCAMIDEKVLVGKSKNGKLDYKLLKIEGLKAVEAKGNYLILEKEDSYLVTTVSHLFESKFISKIAKNGARKNLFVNKKTLCIVDDSGANFYEINTGKLFQRIPSEKLKYSAFDGKKLYLFAGNVVSVYV